MQVIGYKLVRVSDGAVVQQWGGSFAGLVGKPGVLYLPSGEHVHCPEMDVEYFGYRLEQWQAVRPATVDDVKREAQRRIIAITGAGDLLAAMIKQSNANMRANELNDKRVSGEVLTAEEQVEADALRLLATAIKAVRNASNVIEAALPETFSEMIADPRWP
jgi:hypothetical protein